MKSSELMLKPCPFCGKPVNRIKIEMTNESGNFRTVGLVVKCHSCGAETSINTVFGREDAIDKWNRRADE